jgi:uncharacterized protein YhaN
MTIHALTQASPVARDGLAVAADVALVGLGAFALVAAFAVVVLLLQLRRLGSQIAALGRELNAKVDPVVEKSRTVAANLEFVSASVRTDVEKVTGAVRQLSDRLEQASDHMEARIDEFNALMEVVQGEAESTFLDTASAVRGVKAGARSLSGESGEGESGK